MQIISKCILMIGGLIAMFVVSPIVMLCVVVASIIPVVIALIYGRRLTDKEKKTSDENEGFVDQVKDLLGGFVVIKSFKAEKEVLNLFSKQNNQLENAKKDRRDTNDTVNIMSSVSSTIVLIVVFTIGTYMVFNGQLSIGSIIAFIQLSNYILGPILQLVPLWSNRKAALKLIDKISIAVADTDQTVSERRNVGGFNNSIIVTHKLDESLMKKYDEIIVMGKSGIVEKGDFDTLMEKKEYFYSLFNVSQ